MYLLNDSSSVKSTHLDVYNNGLEHIKMHKFLLGCAFVILYYEYQSFLEAPHSSQVSIEWLKDMERLHNIKRLTQYKQEI
jgi:hypothetical protein